MSQEDSELERLKARRLAEMQRNISSKQEAEQRKTEEGKDSVASPRDLLVSRLGFRGLEVLENAESQFPNETRLITARLSELVRSGEIAEVIDGGSLLSLFRSVGLYVRMATKIHVEQDGKFVSLSDKLGNKSPKDAGGGDDQ